MISQRIFGFEPGEEGVQLSDNFTAGEFVGKKGRGKPWFVSTNLVNLVQALRSSMNMPIRINSGYRDYAYNKAIGGAKNSKHMLGIAVDIAIPPGVTGMYMAAKLYQLGARRIGIAPTFVHIDTAPGEAYWVYDRVGSGRFKKQKTRAATPEEVARIKCL